MTLRSLALGLAGSALLGVAGWMATFPRPNPRPDLPELRPLLPGERLVLMLDSSGVYPPPESLGLIQRARAAGADVRVVPSGEAVDSFSPHRVFQPAPWPESPAGYHPDQWPVMRPDAAYAPRDWHLLVLTPEETAVKKAAVLDAARLIRESGRDDPRGTRELQMLRHARRGEIYAIRSP